jgi:mono/diheme cytochrome c family protein
VETDQVVKIGRDVETHPVGSDPSATPGVKSGCGDVQKMRIVFEPRRLANWSFVMSLAGGPVLSGLSVAGLAQPATDRRTVWEGVYSADQAQRGRQQYVDSCAGCHKEDLLGDGVTPGLAGDEFIEHWDKETVEDLFKRIKATMPADRPGSLADADYLDVVAFLLKENGFPGGASELRREGDDSLRNTLIVREKK